MSCGKVVVHPGQARGMGQRAPVARSLRRHASVLSPTPAILRGSVSREVNATEAGKAPIEDEVRTYRSSKGERTVIPVAADPRANKNGKLTAKIERDATGKA